MPSQSDLVNLVVQNPGQFFNDFELRTATTKKRPGVTTAWNWGSGGFGWVYRMVLPAGRTYAVKFFKVDDPSRDQRAGQITGFLKGLTPYPSFLIEFSYVQRATRYKQNVLKLEWVDGLELQVYIERRANDAAALLSVGQQLGSCVRELQRLGIAHGDLQQGNILVDGKNNIRLVDYDGMYIPAFAGLKATEDGLPSCQHPGRSRSVFNPRIDSFSALSLILTFRALAARPDLGQMFPPGSDKLLFTSDDYRNPATSPLFTELVSSRDIGVRRLTDALSVWCRTDFAKIPELKAVLDPIEQSTPKFWQDVQTGGTVKPRSVRPAPPASLLWLPAPPVAPPPSLGTPVIGTVSTSPSQPIQGQQFTFIIGGDRFDVGSAEVTLSTRNGGSERVLNTQLSKKTASMIVGAVTLNTVGNWGVSVQNAHGPQSNVAPITVIPAKRITKLWPLWKVAGSALIILFCIWLSVRLFSHKPPTVYFYGKPDVTTRGQPVVLSWSVGDATSVRIEPGIGVLPAQGSRTISPQATTRYTLTAEGPFGALAVDFIVRVEPSPKKKRKVDVPIPTPTPSIATFQADRRSIERGASTSLHWSVSGSTAVRIEPGLGILPAQGDRTISPTESTQYTLIAEGTGGNVQGQVTVRVEARPKVIVEPPPPPPLPVAAVPTIAAFEAVPSPVEQCTVAILRWTVKGASNASIGPEVGNVDPSSGYKVVRPIQTTRYTLRADGPGGSVSRDVTLSVVRATRASCGQ